MKKIDLDALFLGPKSENKDFLKKMLETLIDEHVHWRRNFHPDDPAAVSHQAQRSEPFLSTWDKAEEVLFDLSNKLKSSSMPWFSPRYLGHMNSDVLLPAVLGYLATILYNPNNCAYEGSPATTEMEVEVGRQLGVMMGYDPGKTWGHITSGGTVANYEALWCARNLKSIPLALREVCPERVAGRNDWQLMNLPAGEILDLLDDVREDGLYEKVLSRSVRGTGLINFAPGKVLIPQSKHYSWTKAQDIFGLGQDNLVMIPLKSDFRADMDQMRSAINGLVDRQIPILCVVAVTGTTEEGAVDEVHELVEFREDCRKQGIWFHVHVDAAYGGYARSIFLDEQNRFMDLDEARDVWQAEGVLEPGNQGPGPEVHRAYKAMAEADSITVDCHKLGYIPYSAGAVVYRDRRIIELLSYKAAYVDGQQDPVLLGPFILEGSKPGAAAAAAWAAHRVVPLNVSGYGRIIGKTIDAATAFHQSLEASEPFVSSNGKTFAVRPLTVPDLNMVTFLFNEKGNEDLAVMNRINEHVYERCSYVSGPVYRNDFITSKTFFTPEEYGDAPIASMERMGIPATEWSRVKKLFVLRSTVMTPFLSSHASFEKYWGNFVGTMQAVLDGL